MGKASELKTKFKPATDFTLLTLQRPSDARRLATVTTTQ
jgi:hypothetical protein